VSAPDDPHRGQPILDAGAPLAEALGAMILIHGRGANAADILGLAQAIDRPRLAYLAPDAAGHVWYPRPFTAPQAANEPWLGSALSLIGRIFADLLEEGIPPERVVLLGFSQGACLSLEYAARNPRRYGGVVALSGGLIGEAIAPANYSGSLGSTPAFLGCSDMDPFIPLGRVQESSAIMRQLDGDVTERIYRGAGHTVVADEIAAIQELVDRVTS
jgi:predicted esterase